MYLTRKLLLSCLLPGLVALALVPACAGSGRRIHAPVDGKLQLDTVVLYRNGVGYFERRGEVEGDLLRLRVRKDQVNDLLKSLTIVDEDGQAVSISMPLDPRTWANAALATLAPGNGTFAEILDAMRGTHVRVTTSGYRTYRGRIVMIERTVNEPDPDAVSTGRAGSPANLPDSRDHKLTLLVGDRMEVVRLSKVRSVTLEDGDLAMQLQRSMDATAGEGMFEQVEVEVRLVGARSHRLRVSYVVEAPMWKPTYRVVLPEGGKGSALLQGWAVVDNTSGEDWNAVNMSLTSGAPIAFRYDLHTPRNVFRSDLTDSGVHKQARVALGETSYRDADKAAEAPREMELEEEAEASEEFRAAIGRGRMSASGEDDDADMSLSSSIRDAKASDSRPTAKAKRARRGPPAPATRGGNAAGWADEDRGRDAAVDMESLRRSTLASARSKQMSGLTRVDLGQRVTVPDGTSTMVAVLNEQVEAEETFLFRPGGAGSGYEANPYHVVRFVNSTKYVLEPGPISIYSGGSFVGEGLSEAVGSNTSVTIPFAVEPGIMVTSSKKYDGQQMRITRIVRGILEVESFNRSTTRYDVRGPKKKTGYRVLVRHSRQGSEYVLAERPEGTEDLDGAYLVPVVMAAGKQAGHVEIVEQTPSKTTLTIWDQRATRLLTELLSVSDLDAKARARLQPIVDARQRIGKIDTQIEGKRKQEQELDQRAEQTRRNLQAIKKDRRAGALRGRLSKRLEEFTKQGDKLGREIVALNSQRLEKKIELEDMMQDLDLRVPVAGKPARK